MNHPQYSICGGTVIWDNQDNALHTATSGNPDTATPDDKFDTGLVGANQQSKPVTMPTEPGDYTYFCQHPFPRQMRYVRNIHFFFTSLVL